MKRLTRLDLVLYAFFAGSSVEWWFESYVRGFHNAVPPYFSGVLVIFYLLYVAVLLARGPL